jgi:hypothetical protein
MPPQNTGTGVVTGSPEELRERNKLNANEKPGFKKPDFSTEKWNYWDHLYPVNIAYFIVLHLGAIYGLKLAIFDAKFVTFLFGMK